MTDDVAEIGSSFELLHPRTVIAMKSYRVQSLSRFHNMGILHCKRVVVNTTSYVCTIQTLRSCVKFLQSCSLQLTLCFGVARLR